MGDEMTPERVRALLEAYDRAAEVVAVSRTSDGAATRLHAGVALHAALQPLADRAPDLARAYLAEHERAETLLASVREHATQRDHATRHMMSARRERDAAVQRAERAERQAQIWLASAREAEEKRDHAIIEGFGVRVTIYHSSIDGTPMVDVDTLADEDEPSVRIHLNDAPLYEHPELVPKGDGDESEIAIARERDAAEERAQRAEAEAARLRGELADERALYEQTYRTMRACDDARHDATVAADRMREVVDAARELASWDWLWLLREDCEHSDDVRADAKRLDAALARLDGGGQ